MAFGYLLISFCFPWKVAFQIRISFHIFCLPLSTSWCLYVDAEMRTVLFRIHILSMVIHLIQSYISFRSCNANQNAVWIPSKYVCIHFLCFVLFVILLLFRGILRFACTCFICSIDFVFFFIISIIMLSSFGWFKFGNGRGEKRVEYLCCYFNRRMENESTLYFPSLLYWFGHAHTM